MVAFLRLSSLCVAFSVLTVFADNEISSKLHEDKISIHITDSRGRPVKGAEVYSHFLRRDGNEAPPLAISDKDGNALFEINDAFGKYGVGGVIYARYKKEAGIELVSRSDKKISIRLKSACRVFGKITTPHSDKERNDNCRTKVCIGLLGFESLIYSSKENSYEFFLPEGRHWFKAYGCSGENDEMFTIEPDQKELELNIELKPTEFRDLIGEEAVGFKNTKAWLNGQEVQLEELKGKVVLLDFWGHWCGRCIREMPKTMDLYTCYKKDGFEVLGIHECDNISGEQLQVKLDEISKNRWKGKTLNFPVIIDIGDKVFEEGTTPIGPLGNGYLIKRFPTQILIGRDGKIISDIPYWDFDFENDLRERLNINPDDQ